MDLSHYDQLAAILDYPGREYLARVGLTAAQLRARYPAAAEALDRLLVGLPHGDLQVLRELFTRTFEVQAIVTMDIGYILFGDDYKRGMLLANLNGEHRKAQNDCVTELADHLPNVLRLLPRLQDEALRDELVTQLVAPAVRRMVREFDATRMKHKDLLYKKHYKTIIQTSETARTAYRDALQAVFEVLQVDFELETTPIVERTSPFMLGIGTEMHTEACNECSATTTAGAKP